MPLIFDHSRQPPGGHYFPDPSGYTVRAKTLHDLIGSITSYRINNGFPRGNPALEVEEFYAVEFPWLITKVGDRPESNIDPITKWINRTYREAGHKFAESETTKARSAICEACPYYEPHHSFGIEDNRRLIITGGGRLKQMGACKVHHIAVGLAVVLDKVEVPLKVDDCWIT